MLIGNNYFVLPLTVFVLCWFSQIDITYVEEEPNTSRDGTYFDQTILSMLLSRRWRPVTSIMSWFCLLILFSPYFEISIRLQDIKRSF